MISTNRLRRSPTGCRTATRNTADFEGIGLALINPWPAA